MAVCRVSMSSKLPTISGTLPKEKLHRHPLYFVILNIISLSLPVFCRSRGNYDNGRLSIAPIAPKPLTSFLYGNHAQISERDDGCTKWQKRDRDLGSIFSFNPCLEATLLRPLGMSSVSRKEMKYPPLSDEPSNEFFSTSAGFFFPCETVPKKLFLDRLGGRAQFCDNLAVKAIFDK